MIYLLAIFVLRRLQLKTLSTYSFSCGLIREAVCRAFGYVISDAPLAAVIGEAHKVIFL